MFSRYVTKTKTLTQTSRSSPSNGKKCGCMWCLFTGQESRSNQSRDAELFLLPPSPAARDDALGICCSHGIDKGRGLPKPRMMFAATGRKASRETLVAERVFTATKPSRTTKVPRQLYTHESGERSLAPARTAPTVT